MYLDDKFLLYVGHNYEAQLEYVCKDRRQYVTRADPNIPPAASVVSECFWNKTYGILGKGMEYNLW